MLEGVASSWCAFLVVGVCAGILSGTLGVGSGIIIIPTLVLLFHFPQKTAQGMSLILMVPMALLGALEYWKNGHVAVSPAVLALLIAGGLGGVLVGVGIVNHLPDAMLRKGFALLLIVVAIRMFLMPQESTKNAPGGIPGNISLEKEEQP